MPVRHQPSTDPPAPVIDAAAVAERWSSLTPADLADLRQRRILIASKSIGLNLVSGLRRLAERDPACAFSIRQFDVEKKGGLPVVPAESLDRPGIVQILASRYPLAKRVEEVDALLRRAPWSWGGRIDAALTIYSWVEERAFPAYARLMEALAADFPRLRILHTTPALNAPGAKAGDNAEQHAFGERLRERYRGRQPIYDLAAILSRDARDGPAMCPDYTTDPTGVHPNQPAAEIALAQGFLLAVRDALRWTPGPVRLPPLADAAAAEEGLPTDHPQRRLVRAILDRNGLTQAQIDGLITVRQGRIVGLFLQEAGITELPDEIGELTGLEVLHVYGDRSLPHPLLQRLSPRLARCTALRELLLNHNELTTLPAELAALTQVTTLSLADNRLRDLPAAVEVWARQRDPLGLPAQNLR